MITSSHGKLVPIDRRGEEVAWDSVMEIWPLIRLHVSCIKTSLLTPLNIPHGSLAAFIQKGPLGAQKNNIKIRK